MNVPTRGKVGIWRAGCMFSVVTLFVWGENIVCFLAKDCLKKQVTMPEKEEKVPNFVRKRPVFAGFSLFSVLKCGFQGSSFVWFVCKDFAICLCVSLKDSFAFVLFHRPRLRSERSESQAVWKSKCHFATSESGMKRLAGKDFISFGKVVFGAVACCHHTVCLSGRRVRDGAVR